MLGEAAARSCAFTTRTDVCFQAVKGPRGTSAKPPAAPEGLKASPILPLGTRAGLMHSIVPRTAPGRAATFIAPTGRVHRKVGPATSASSACTVRTDPPSSRITPGETEVGGPTRRLKKVDVASAAKAPGSAASNSAASSPPFDAVTEKRPVCSPRGLSVKASAEETTATGVRNPPTETAAPSNMCAPSRAMGSPSDASCGITVATCATAWYWNTPSSTPPLPVAL